MADDKRMDRLEDKVDSVKTEVSELRTDFKIHSAQVTDKLETFDDHISGDNKIINHIQPLLEKLPDIVEVVEDYRFEKKKKEEKIEKRKKFTWKLGIVATVVGIFAGISRIFGG